MFKNLGVQLYTIRDYMKDPEIADVAFAKLARLGYTEAHTAGCEFDPILFRDLLAKHGINIIGTHYDWGKIVSEPEETMALHRLWGTTNVGIGGMPGPARKDLDELKKFIEEFNRTAELYAKNGFRLTYHNHHFEFIRIDGYKTLMDYLYEGLDPATTSFVLDTCWVSAGGGDVVDWMHKLKGRIDILHLKDMGRLANPNPSHCFITEIGQGNIWWEGVIESAIKAGVKSYVVEQDTCPGDPFDSLKISSDYLHANFM